MAFPTRSIVGTKSFLLISFLITSLIGVAEDKTEWQRNIDWAHNDTGAPDCPGLYTATTDLQACAALGLATGNKNGNRKCVIELAMAAAKTGDPRLEAVAYSYVLLTQCHNDNARRGLENAGLNNVVAYLKGM